MRSEEFAESANEPPYGGVSVGQQSGEPGGDISRAIDPTTNSLLAEYLVAIENHLFTGIIPFWNARARDVLFGGFMTNFDERGTELAVPEKYLNTQCRLVWWFSTLFRRFPAMTEAGVMATAGVDFLLKHFWDGTYGGFRWKVERDGSELDSAKIVYGESFSIYALSEYYLATGDKRGLKYAELTFDLLQKYGADTQHGGYLENLERDWTPAEDGFCGGDRKSLDTHMHLMEAFTTLYAASGYGLHRRKLVQIIDLICARMIDKATGCGLNQFDLAFRPLPHLSIKRTWNGERLGKQPSSATETTSYGHNAELAYLMQCALRMAGKEIGSYQSILHGLLNHTLTHGVDWECGGIFRDGESATGKASVLQKEFWQHSEVLVSFLDGYELFGDPRYLDGFGCVWRFVQDHMIVDGVGEWRTLLDQCGEPIDSDLGNPWKVSYHTGRSMLECRDRLRRLLRRQP